VNPFPRLRKIIDEAERQKVYAAIKADNDNLNHASHVWERGGEIVGAASLGAVPVLLGWHHQTKISARDSFHMLRVYEAVFDSKGFSIFYTLVNKRSPYNSFMPQFGYKSIWETEVFVGGSAMKEEKKSEPVQQIEVPRMR
jgi:hypothetical protein